MKKRESGGNKYKMDRLKRKRKLMCELGLVLREGRRVKESPDLNRNNGRGTWGKDPTQLSFQPMKGKGLRNNPGTLNGFKVVKVHFNLAVKCIRTVYVGLALDSRRIHK